MVRWLDLKCSSFYSWLVKSGHFKQVYVKTECILQENKTCTETIIQSNFSGSDTFGTMKISSKQG